MSNVIPSNSFYQNFPLTVDKQYMDPSSSLYMKAITDGINAINGTDEIKRLTDENEKLKNEIRLKTQAHNIVVHQFIAELNEKKSHLDEAVRFIAGLNLQDHTVSEQRKQRDIVSRLTSSLNKNK